MKYIRNLWKTLQDKKVKSYLKRKIIKRKKMNNITRQKSVQLNKAVKLISRSTSKTSKEPPMWVTPVTKTSQANTSEFQGKFNDVNIILQDIVPIKKMALYYFIFIVRFRHNPSLIGQQIQGQQQFCTFIANHFFESWLINLSLHKPFW